MGVLDRERTIAPPDYSRWLLLYLAVPSTKALSSAALFVGCTCVILSMYGGGFATVPAYLRDLFGTKEVGAIHGRLLTAWSTAALVGPSIVTYAREYQIRSGVAKSDAYSKTMYGLAALLAIGCVCNAKIAVGKKKIATAAPAAQAIVTAPAPPLRLLFYWSVVVLPLGWGVAQVAVKSLALFR